MGDREDGFTRLNKLLAHYGVASRRHVEEMIVAGRVTVDGTTATEKGMKVGPGAVIEVDGTPVAQPPAPVWLALHKPKGYICTKEDTHDRPMVIDLVPPDLKHVHPVGRLDGDVSGLLLMTNQGELTHRLTHPRYEVDKVYRAVTSRPLTARQRAALQNGVELDDGPSAPAKCQPVGRQGPGAIVDLVIHEGRKHQVKRMFEAVGNPLTRLERIAIGPVRLGDMPRGHWRHLTPEEVAELYRLTGLAAPPGAERSEAAHGGPRAKAGGSGSPVRGAGGGSAQ